MSYHSDRARFLSNTLLRVVAVAAVVMFAITFAVIAPSPALAATDEAKNYTFDVKVAPRADARFTVDVVVFDPEGNRVMSSSAVGEGGKPLVLVSEQAAANPGDARQYRVEVDVASEGPSRATLKVSDGEKRVLHSSTQHSSWTPRPSELPADAQPVTRPPVEVPAGYEQLSDAITAPVLMKRVEPQYPEEARAQRVAGICIVQALVDENGIVTETRVLKPLPFGLSDAAAAAVKQWVFEPAKKDGVPVKVAFNVTVNFRLEKDEPAAESAPSPEGEAENTATSTVDPIATPAVSTTTPPVLIKRVEPRYLEAARRERTTGTVIVRALIDETGVVRETEVVRSLPNGLSQEAERAVRQWVFEPALVDGKPVAMSFDLSVDFRLGARR